MILETVATMKHDYSCRYVAFCPYLLPRSIKDRVRSRALVIAIGDPFSSCESHDTESETGIC